MYDVLRKLAILSHRGDFVEALYVGIQALLLEGVVVVIWHIDLGGGRKHNGSRCNDRGFISSANPSRFLMLICRSSAGDSGCCRPAKRYTRAFLFHYQISATSTLSRPGKEYEDELLASCCATHLLQLSKHGETNNTSDSHEHCLCLLARFEDPPAEDLN